MDKEKTKSEKESSRKNLRKDNRKILLATIILGVLLFGIIVVSIVFFNEKMNKAKSVLNSNDYKTYDSYYVMITDNSDSEYWRTVYEGAQEEAKKNNIYVEFMGDNLNSNLTKQEKLQIAINSSVDGILVEGDDSNKTTDLLLQAKDAGIPVVTVSEDLLASKRESFIGVSNYNLGWAYGDLISDTVKEKQLSECEVLILMDDSVSDNRQSIITAAIRENLASKNQEAKVTFDSLEISNKKDYAAEEEIRDIFVKRDHDPDIIVALSEKNTACLCQTVVDYNKVGDVEILGYYMSPTIEAAINKDIIRASIVVDTRQMGHKAVEAMMEFRNTGYVSEFFQIDTSFATKENLNQYVQPDSKADSSEEGGEEDASEGE